MYIYIGMYIYIYIYDVICVRLVRKYKNNEKFNKINHWKKYAYY